MLGPVLWLGTMETLRPGVIGTGHCAGLPNPTWNPKMWMKVGLGVRVSVLDPHLTVGVL